MKRIALLILLLIPLVASAQRMEVYTCDGYKYLSLYAYGLPRSVVKTNAEMRASQMNGNGTGVMKRHHTTKGINERIGDKGYNGNDKISFAFIVAPYNVDAQGNHTQASYTTLSWAEASGYDVVLNSEYSSYDLVTGVGIGESPVAATPTGCAAYRGAEGHDNPGDWRLPTQREMQVMFTVIEQAYGHIASGSVVHQIIEGVYWTSTEFYASGEQTKGWSIGSASGRPLYEPKTTQRMVRCVKDIYEPINE